MRSGARNFFVVFQRSTTAADDYGQPIDTWADYVSALARVTFGSGEEKRQAAQEAAQQSATFECLRTTKVDSVTVQDRIVFDGSDWDIVSRDPLDRRNIRFTGIRIA